MNIRDILGAVLVAAFITSLNILFWKAIPKENEQLIVYMLGQLSGFVSAVVALHYVTKAGEKELDEKRADNTSKAFDAIKAAQESTPAATDPNTLREGDKVELNKADET